MLKILQAKLQQLCELRIFSITLLVCEMSAIVQ